MRPLKPGPQGRSGPVSTMKAQGKSCARSLESMSSTRSTDVPRRSGDLLNATTGEVVGTVLSFADNGVTADSGSTFPSGMMPITWSTDGHFASASFVGVG